VELLIVIIGVVLVWKFASVLNTLSLAANTKAEVMCEEVLIEAVTERAELVKQFSVDVKSEEIFNHSEILKLMKIKK
tara:strand:+ start:1351 stop:1581 length:231 start_codon:yes stop_codon:yes gene_type:complete